MGKSEQAPVRRKPIGTVLVQRYFVHYRRGLFTALAQHPELDFTLLYGSAGGPGGVRNVEDPGPVRTWLGPTYRIGPRQAPLFFMPHMVTAARRPECEVLIVPNDFTFLSLFPALRAAWQRGAKVVIFAIGFGQYRQPVRDRLRVWLAHRVDALVLYSAAHRQRYIECGVPAEKVFLAPNAMNTDEMRAAEQALTHESLAAFRERHGLADRDVIIHVGRMVERKRLDLLLRAAQGLLPRRPRLKLVLIGSGPMLEPWQDLARDLALTDHVIWPGEITDHHELCHWFKSSLVCVAPGQQGLIANISQGYGVPIIVCDKPKLLGPEIQVFTNRVTGLQYRFGDVGDLADKIAELLADGTRRNEMGAAAWRTIHEEFTLQRQVQGFVNAIHYALGDLPEQAHGGGRA